MTNNPQTYQRILAIAPASRGFGYALVEGQKLVLWGVRSVTGDKNNNCVMKVEALIIRYKPEVMVLEDTGAEGSRHSPRIRELSQMLLALSLEHNIPVAWFRREQMMKFFFGKSKGTKQEIAQRIGNRFPEELGALVPPKRRTWMSQHYQIDMFDAVALALMLSEHRKA
jgi:Holliday junction resolvasome RuvABC endonuclease subunit